MRQRALQRAGLRCANEPMLTEEIPEEGTMHVVGLDHLVVNTQNLERASTFITRCSAWNSCS